MIHRAILVLLLIHPLQVTGFSPTRQADPRPGTVQLAKRAADPGAFEMQELRAQLNAMKKNGINSRDLDPLTRASFANYARQIVSQRPSPVAPSRVGQNLAGTSWRLVLSTDDVVLGGLPQDATICMKFRDASMADYVLQFSEKTFGINAITAESKWSCNNQGLVSLEYEKITTDAFGFAGIGVSFFGLLKGRSTYVQTAYLDDYFWIEQNRGPTGQDYLNVYVREDDE